MKLWAGGREEDGDMQDQTLKHSKTAEVLHSVWKNKIMKRTNSHRTLFLYSWHFFFCFLERLNEELGVQPKNNAAAACHQIGVFCIELFILEFDKAAECKCLLLRVPIEI